MLELDIPGFGHIIIKHLVSDFTGTLSVDGKLIDGVRERLNELANTMKIHILTADTFGKAVSELQGVNCEITILTGENHDIQKEDFVKKLDAQSVMAIGNGNNDRRMLQAAKIGVAVCLDEGCAVDALKSADIVVKSPIDGLDLILKPQRLKATLRF